MFTGITNLLQGNIIDGIFQIAAIILAVSAVIAFSLRRDNTSGGINSGIITAAVCALLCDIWWMVYLFGDGVTSSAANPRRMGVAMLCAAGIFILGSVAASAIHSGRGSKAKLWLVSGAGLICAAMALKYILRMKKGIVFMGGGLTDRRFYLVCVIAVASLCFVAVLISERERGENALHRIGVGAALVAVATLIVVSAWQSVYGTENIRYTEISSPDGEYTVVIVEGDRFGDKVGSAYQKRAGVLAQIRGEWEYHVSEALVADGHYTALWEDGHLTLAFSENGKTDLVTIMLEQ